MGTRITFIPATGERLVLLQPGGSDTDISYGGISGMVGEFDVSTKNAVGMPGQVVTTRNLKPMKGTLEILGDTRGGRTIEEIESQIRQAFTQDEEGVLVLERDSRPRLRCRARADGAIPPPREVLEDAQDTELKVSLIADIGAWYRDRVSQSGTVTITNTGDIFLWPTIAWESAGTLTLPSGLVYSLPAVSGLHRLSLDPFTSHEVLRPDGTVNEAATALTEVMWLGEGVPKGQTRTYKTTGGVRVEHALIIRDPWK